MPEQSVHPGDRPLSAKEVDWVIRGLQAPLEDPYQRWDLTEDEIAWIQSLIRSVTDARAVTITAAPGDPVVRDAVAESIEWVVETTDGPEGEAAYALAAQVRAGGGIHFVTE